LKEAGLVKKGDPVVVLSDVLNGEFVVDSVWLKTLD
jgi:hypothetical protein